MGLGHSKKLALLLASISVVQAAVNPFNLGTGNEAIAHAVDPSQRVISSEDVDFKLAHPDVIKKTKVMAEIDAIFKKHEDEVNPLCKGDAQPCSSYTECCKPTWAHTRCCCSWKAANQPRRCAAEINYGCWEGYNCV